MGLDGVELVIAVEDRFGISVEGGEATRLRTVGDLWRLIRRKLPPRRAGRCLTTHTFLRLRGALGRVAGVSRSAVSPGTSLGALLPATGRRRAWRRLERSLECRLPELRLPGRLETALLIVFLAAIPGAWIGGGLGLVPAAVAWAVGLGALPGLLLALAATRPLATVLPAGCETVGQAARAILVLNFAEIAGGMGGASDREVWHAVRDTVAEQLGVDPEAVTPDARFREDLGVD